LDTARVRTVAPEALVVPNVAVTPLGSPLAVSLTAPLKPFCAFT